MQLGAQTPFDGTTAERTALTDLTNHRGRLFFETDTKAVYMCDGASWYPVIVDHDHSGDAGDGGVLEIDEALVATGATTGHVLTVQADDSIAAAAAAGGGAAAGQYDDYDFVIATGNTSTTASSFTALNSMSVSITLSAPGIILAWFNCTNYINATGHTPIYEIFRGTTALSTLGYSTPSLVNSWESVGLCGAAALAAGTYTVNVKWYRSSAGTATSGHRMLSALALLT